MSDKNDWTKAELLAEIDTAWAALNEALDNLPPERMTSPTDEVGWSVKDHVSHLAAWDTWAVYLLQGKPGWEGLGIDEAVYKQGNDDATNAAIYPLHAGKSPAKTRADLLAAHDELMALIAPMDDAVMAGPYRALRPGEPADRVLPSTGNILYGTTAEHYTEHLGWFLELAGA
ncbi:MAG: ClbS/DfsB family four-helix bundle protein [Chloroflexota bacterium]